MTDTDVARQQGRARVGTRLADLVTVERPVLAELPHRYTAPACLHGRHELCGPDEDDQSPGVCGFCDAQCRCSCHGLVDAIPVYAEPAFAGAGVDA